MYLKRLDLQGFKTFAQKTTLAFPPERTDRHHLTVVVGPNGSGKSNLADAIRWCLGEQSLKLLRGKKAEDIIFSGSEGKSRSGFAEVTLTFDNTDHTLPSDYTEVAITRRLYRDGESAYLVNNQEARLTDIHLMLAEAGIGQRSYSVIGQGMIDHVLTATPEERKVFFDDAMGVRGFQIKRHQALLKLQKSAENLEEAEMLLGELTPRLALLKRQADRLSKRAALEEELHAVQTTYYGSQWATLTREREAIIVREREARGKVTQKQAELAEGDATMAAAEQNGTDGKSSDEGLQKLQSAYKKAQEELGEARKTQFAAERELALAKVRAQTRWAPLPLPDIITHVADIAHAHRAVLDRLRAAMTMDDVQTVLRDAEEVYLRSTTLKQRLTQPNPEDFTPEPSLLAALDAAKTRIATAETHVRDAERAMDASAKHAAAQQQELIDAQRKLRALQQEIFALEQRANAVAIDLARTDTRLEDLAREMHDELGDARATALQTSVSPSSSDIVGMRERLLRLKQQLELIGGIDEEVMQEYAAANERHTFLTTQVTDLRNAIVSTEKVIDELDNEIRVQSETAFRAINTEFQRYFKVLFGGGTCSLVKMTQEDVERETHVALDRAMETMAEEKLEQDSVAAIHARVKEREDAVAGIDIQATPPGKRLKALNLLSGGERALTSIALVSAIMATNPSPFVVLDEVDAALDEANTVRFANILQELQKLTQFIVITHNRATMEKADMLYGVTMSGDGVSKLLSVQLDDIGEHGSARR